MMIRKLTAVLAIGAVLGMGACGDEGGSGGELDAEEQAALITALAEGGAFGFNFAAPLVLTSQLSQDADVGTLGDFAAIGGQSLLTVDFPGTENDETLVFTSVTGWTNLDAGARTVDTAVWASVISSTSSYPNSIDGAVMVDDDAFGGYWERSTGSRYLANSGEGQFTLSSASFGSANDCENLPNLGSGITITECSIATGTLQGDFDFVADRFAGTGVATFTQPNIAYDVPAARLTLTLTYSQAPVAAAAR